MDRFRSAAELAATDDPAWPLVRAWVEGSADARVLPASGGSGERTLYRLQVSARSSLGALALNCGGIVVQSGWLRLLGAGHEGLRDLATANGVDRPGGRDRLDWLVVAQDVLGGEFAVNGGGLPGREGEVAYWGPDTLDWTPLGVGHSGFVEWALSPVSVGFFDELRWPGWQDESAALGLDEGIAAFPPPFSPEGRDLGAARRRPVPMAELASGRA